MFLIESIKRKTIETFFPVRTTEIPKFFKKKIKSRKVSVVFFYIIQRLPKQNYFVADKC